MKTVSFHNFSVGHGKREVLRVDSDEAMLKLVPGLTLLSAPNGEGKTTFLRTIAGMIPALSGEVRVQAGAENRRLGEGEVLYVSEYLSFPKYIYPDEWIEFSAGRTPDAAEQAKWVEKFRLAPLMKQYLGKVSQGERRKITWLAAHFSRRPLILLDEPLDGLDLFAITAAREMLSEWKREGRTVLIVAHQMAELLDLADDIFLIRKRTLAKYTDSAGRAIGKIPFEEFQRALRGFYALNG